MTSGGEAMPVLWITGLAGCGKSTLARAVVAELRRSGHAALMLDGDEVREALESGAGPTSHEPYVRLARAWRIAKLAALAAKQGVPAMVATVSLVHEVQRWNRVHNPKFIEVLLTAPLAELAVHRPRLYGSPGQVPARNVVGVDLAAEYPERPDLVLEQDYAQASLARNARHCVDLWKALAVAGVGR